MAKTTNTTARKSAAKAAPKADTGLQLDWNAECGRISAAAKEKALSRGDLLGKLAVTVAGTSPAAMVLREAAEAKREGKSYYGAEAFIDAPRNVLAKLTRLAEKLAAGTHYCAYSALSKEGARSEDASIPVALLALGGGDARQKQIVAASTQDGRYKGGANAQMPAALGALEFFGIVRKLDTGSKRNSQYEIVDHERANSLIPKPDAIVG